MAPSALLILTAARTRHENPWEYLTKTIEGVEREKLPISKGIVVDGDYTGPTLPTGWELYNYRRPAGLLQGNKWPYWHLLRVGRDLGCDVVALEDDLQFCKNAVRRMAIFPVPDDLAWVQFFSPMVFRHFDSYPGLWRPPMGSSLFLQAAKYPARTLEQLISWEERELGFHMYAASDQALPLAAAFHGWNYGAHAPDLVQHVGGISEAQSHEGLNKLDTWRTSQMWGGENWDAMQLYQRDDLYR
jgi:hypothetical protein